MRNSPSGSDPLNELWRNAQQRPVPVVIVVLLVSLFIALAGYPWVWLLGGAIVLAVLWPSLSRTGAVGQGIGANIGSTLAPDPRLDLNRLDGTYRDLMQRALDTSSRIEDAINQTQDPGQRQVLADSTKDLHELTGGIYSLALKACNVRSSLGGANPIDHLTSEIKRLETAISSTNDEFQKSQYYAALDGKLQQMQNITDTMVALRRWDSQVENAVSTLETLLSQVLRIKSSEVLSYSGSTDDFSASLKREVDSLKATSEAMDNVYGWENKV